MFDSESSDGEDAQPRAQKRSRASRGAESEDGDVQRRSALLVGAPVSVDDFRHYAEAFLIKVRDYVAAPRANSTNLTAHVKRALEIFPAELLAGGEAVMGYVSRLFEAGKDMPNGVGASCAAAGRSTALFTSCTF
mmetsp:Transcript_19633/g.67413  ORF Transcript_19633/g.67413 Transcript_19633/m.67413 type:complete len:135 (+) Transcript_19633:100-504(+)